MKCPLCLVAILGMALTACVTSRSDQISRAPERSFFLDVPKEDHAIYLAVLDRMFTRWEGDGPKLELPVRYYISIQNADAPPDLLAALRAKGRDVFPASAYKHGSGVELSLGNVERKGTTKAIVDGGYLFDPEGGEWGTFVLSRRHGLWKVVSWKPTMFAWWINPNAHEDGVASGCPSGYLRTRFATRYLVLT